MVDWVGTGVVLPELETVEATLSFAEAAERAGAQSLWCSGAWGYGPTPLLGALAQRTDCVLGTGIANVFARSPTALAMDALVLDGATDGRFVLGVGTGTPAIVEGFHGHPFDRPVRRVRETIEIVRLALAGERIEYDGACFELDGFELYGVPETGIEVPIVAAALGTTNFAMALEYADGIATYLLPIADVPTALDRGRDRADADRTVPVIAQVPTCVSEDPDEARGVLERHLAFYIGGLEVYHDVVARHGFRETADRIRSAWTNGDRHRARAAVTRELMDAVGVAGTPDRARERLAALADGPVEAVVLTFPEGVDDRMRQLAIEAMADS